MSKLENPNKFYYTKVPDKENKKYNLQDESNIPSYGYGIRHVQLFIFFLCMTMGFLSRGHVSVTIVAMTSHQNKPMHEDNKQNFTVLNKTSGVDDVYDNDTVVSHVDDDTWTVYRTYDWPKPIQEMILSSFFFGYCIMMFPISFVCQRWGGKLPLQISMFVNGVVSLFMPWLALWGGWKALCVCRILQGLSQAGTFPGTQTLLSQWVPVSEKATMSSYVYTGSTVGSVIGFQLGGLLSAYFGWPVTFWVVSVLCFLTFGSLTYFGASSPLEHKKITEEEKWYILGSQSEKPIQKRRAPLKAILTSKPMWANFLTQAGSGVSYMYFLTQVPSYIHYIRGIDVKSSGILSSLPYLGSFFTSLFYGVISDHLTNRKIVSIKNARRIFNTFSQVGVAVSLICASYATNITLTMICLVLAMSCQMATHTGWMVNQIDLAPNYTGTMISIGNTFTNLCGMVIPVLTSNIITDVKNPYQWRIMIFLVAGLAFTCNLVFVFFMTSEVQPWNDEDFNENELTNLPLETSKKKEEQEKDSFNF